MPKRLIVVMVAALVSVPTPSAAQDMCGMAIEALELARDACATNNDCVTFSELQVVRREFCSSTINRGRKPEPKLKQGPAPVPTIIRNSNQLEKKALADKEAAAEKAARKHFEFMLGY